MYSLGTWSVSGIYIYIPCRKEVKMMVMMMMIIIIIIVLHMLNFRDMVCLRNICINTLQKGTKNDDDDDDNNNNNNNNNNLAVP
jgi:hypothetical protein